jgi:hypothetical protein
VTEHGTTTRYRAGCRCDSCRAATRAYKRGPEVRQKAKAYSDRNRDRVRARERKRAAEQKISNPAARRDAYLRSRYGISLADWEARFEQQGRVCALCASDDPGFKHGWHTDHEHAAGRFRGVLCKQCNITLGFIGDTTEEIEAQCVRILNYLKRSPP